MEGDDAIDNLQEFRFRSCTPYQNRWFEEVKSSRGRVDSPLGGVWGGSQDAIALRQKKVVTLPRTKKYLFTTPTPDKDS